MAAADATETEAIAADLRKQLQQLKEEHVAVAQQAAERKERELERGGRGLMGQVAQKHEEKLKAAQLHHAEAKQRLAVHLSVLSREVREAETPAGAALAVADGTGTGAAAANGAADGRHASSSPQGSATAGEDKLASEDAADAALASSLQRIEASFNHVRAPPELRPPALVARWRRLQLGEPFERRPWSGGGPSSSSGGGNGGGRVWVALSADLHHLELGAAKGAPATERLPLSEVVRLDSDARQLTLHTVRGAPLVLAAADAAMLVFWYAGVQDLCPCCCRERLSRGALLWRAARHLWRQRAR